MKQFKTDIEGAFAQPLSLNIYDSEFYSQVGGLKIYIIDIPKWLLFYQYHFMGMTIQN